MMVPGIVLFVDCDVMGFSLPLTRHGETTNRQPCRVERTVSRKFLHFLRSAVSFSFYLASSTRVFCLLVSALTTLGLWANG